MSQKSICDIPGKIDGRFVTSVISSKNLRLDKKYLDVMIRLNKVNES
jgi:hypothetical protein